MKIKELHEIYVLNHKKIDFIEAFCEKITKSGDKQSELMFKFGECGFGRPCVGIIFNDDYWLCYEDGFDEETHESKEVVTTPPDEVSDAYHKHDCITVLKHGDISGWDKAINQLYIWVQKLDKLNLKVVNVPRNNMLRKSEPTLVEVKK